MPVALLGLICIMHAEIRRSFRRLAPRATTAERTFTIRRDIPKRGEFASPRQRAVSTASHETRLMILSRFRVSGGASNSSSKERSTDGAAGMPRFLRRSSRSSFSAAAGLSAVSKFDIARRLPITRSCGKLHQPKAVFHSEQRFGVTKEEISAFQQVAVEMADYSFLRLQIEIDEHIAAKNYVEAGHEEHALAVVQVELLELHLGAYFVAYVEAVAVLMEVLGLESGRGVPQRVRGVDA